MVTGLVRSGLTLLSVWGVKTEGGSDEQSRSSSPSVRARVQTTSFLVYSRRRRRRRTTTTIIIKYTIIIIPFKATGRPPPRAYAHTRTPKTPPTCEFHNKPLPLSTIYYEIHGHNRGSNPQLCLPREIFVILFFSTNCIFLSITFFKFNKNNNTITTIIKTISIVQSANTHRHTI